MQPRKLVYTSRTHSQLKQFTGELRKITSARKLIVMPLASRAQCCINDTVNSKPNDILTEMCNAMKSKGDGDDEQPVKKPDNRPECPYAKMINIAKCASRLGTYSTQHDCVYDIEDVVKLGKSMNACPYYALHHANQAADVCKHDYICS